MIARVIAYVTAPATLALAKKLGSVWLFSFVAASGGIIARKLHHDRSEPQPPQPGRKRPYIGPNVWRRRP